MNLIPIIALVIIAIAATTYSFWKIGDRDSLVSYIGVISSVGIVIVFASFIVNYEMGNTTAQISNDTMFDTLTTEGWIDIEKMFNKEYPYLSRLYRQMYPSIPYIYEVPVDDEALRLNKETHACQIILREIENVFLGNGGLSTNWQTQQMSWLYSFQQWLSSDILRREWEGSKHLYRPDTRTFIDTVVIPGISKTLQPVRKL
jgi:hypothetical protein